MDESGLLMAPCLRRTWALRGETPHLEQRTLHREKVSVAAALWWPPGQDHLSWSFETLVNGYFNNQRIAAFVQRLLARVGTPLVLLWDSGTLHRGEPIRQLLAEEAGRLSLEPLPAYAPELNPVEFAWSWLKYDRLCNLAASDADHLNEEIFREMHNLRRSQRLLRGFFEATQLPLPRALLS